MPDPIFYVAELAIGAADLPAFSAGYASRHAPDLFLLAAERMGAEPARTLVIEDSLTGIRAGLAAGMTVWRFVGGSHLGPDTPVEPADATPHRRLVSFAGFFQIAPDLQKGARRG